MPATVVGSPTLYESASASSAVVPVPSGVTAGELLVVAVAHSSGTPIVGSSPAGYSGGYTSGYAATSSTPPAGWTLVGNAQSTTNAIAVLYRVAISSEPASYTFPTATGAVSGRMVRLAGVNTSSPIDGSATTATTGGPTTADLTLDQTTPALAGDQLFSAFSIGTTASGVAPSAPVEMDALGAANSTGVKLGLAVQGLAVAGGTGTRTWSTSGAGTTQYGKVGVLVAFANATVGAVQVTSTRPTSWRTLAAVTSTRSTSWNVEGSPGKITVSSTRSTSWAVLSGSSVSSTRSTSWRTLAPVTSTRSTYWSVVGAVTTATTRPTMRLKVYAPLGADQGPLPTPESVSVSYALNDAGGLSLNYATQAPRSNLLGQPCEIAVEISPDSGRTWIEPRNSRFVYMADGRDPRNQADRYAVEAKSYVWRMSKAYIDGSNLNADGKRAFLSASPGVVLKTLLNAAQARGALSGISHASFTTGNDSSGAPWSKQLTIYYEPGLDLLSVLTNLADQGFIDFAMQGRALQVYNPDTTLAQHRDTGANPVTFRPGRDITEAPFRRTWEGLADSFYFAGDAGAKYEYTNPSAVTPWGRQEKYIANGSVSDQGTMAALTQAEAAQSDRERTEYTYGLDFTRAVHMPLWDYSVGDYVLSAVDSTTPPVALRVRQLTLTNNDKNILGGNVVLNDRFLEADIRAKRRVDGITNGASGNAPLPGNPPGESDKVAPAKVTGLSGSSVGYQGPGGYAQAQVTLSWAAVTTNVDGTVADDIDRYELFRRQYGQPASAMRQFASTTDTTFSDSPYQSGSNWWFAVRAVDQSGNRGALSNDVGLGMATDITPPQAPSAPTVTASVGVLKVAWDGQPATGTWPLDFDHVNVHQSTVNNFTPTDANLIDRFDGAEISIVSGVAYGVPLYFRLVAVDRAGLKSDPSVQASGTPRKLVGSDIDGGAITYEQIGFKDPGNIVPDGSFETEAGRATILNNGATLWSFTSAEQYHGAWSATIDGATGSGTTRQLPLMRTADAQQIQATEKLFVRMAYKCTAGSNGVLQTIVHWLMNDGSNTYSSVTASLKNGTWQQAAAQLTAPAGVTSFRIYLQLTSAGTTGQNYVDVVEVRRTVGTAIIQDAAIQNAQIDNLAVNSAKISDLEVGKLTAGQLNADVLIAARLRTATSGNRVEMSATGIRMYKGSFVTGHWNPAVGQLRIYSASDLSHTSSGHGFQIGDDNTFNLAFDNNEIMARFNGTPTPLYINREGGRIVLGGKIGGFAENGSDAGVFPADDDHQVIVNGFVEISNTRDGDYASEVAPLMVGPRGSYHMWFDSNEMGASSGDGVDTLYIQPRKQDGSNHGADTVLASNALRVVRTADEIAGIGGYAGPSSGLQFYLDQVRVTNSTYSAYRSIQASAFTVASQAAVKTDVTEIADPLAVVMAAPSRRYRYVADVADEQPWHVGPMLEDLPKWLHRDIGDGRLGIDLHAEIGLLWEALRQLAQGQTNER